MAQAVFEEHPLEKYFRDAGETSDPMPGASSDMLAELGDAPEISLEEEDEVDMANLYPQWVQDILQVIHSVMPGLTNRTSPFVERFKYDVISSSLLATSLQSPFKRSPSPIVPDTHRRIASDASGHYPGASLFTEYRQYWLSSLVVAIFTVLRSGYYFLAVVILAGSLYIFTTDPFSKTDMAPSIEALSDLIAAGDVWESVVHETLASIENDEKNTFYGPKTPSSTSSPLRVALQSSLHTTQTQCDNVRHLLSALTAPSNLSQISEMYAPPSPSPFIPRSLSPPLPSPTYRPVSLPTSPPDAFHPRHGSTMEAKRSTWNGSYSTLAHAGSPTMGALKRREKRRSELSALLQTSANSSADGSTPSPLLDEVPEEEDEPMEVSLNFDLDEDYRPVSAGILDLRRKRRASGMAALGISTTHHRTNSSFTFPRTPVSPFSAASRFTTRPPPTRHPLSLSALNQSLDAALAAKRYACSHLLALRFNEDDSDEGYWEDVRAVMGLLTSTLGDSSARLTEALEMAETAKLKDQHPSPSPSRSCSIDVKNKKKPATMFAPVPSHLTRFATHVEAISDALGDARECLVECVSALKGAELARKTEGEGDEHPALQAYERLRRELGLALRECERGREKLLDIVAPPREDSASDDEEDDLPALSDDSDKPDSTSVVDEHEVQDVGHDHNDVAVVSEAVDPATMDDVTAHLLLATSSQHLPPPGVEQVYEGETGSGMAFARERSKLSREERIALAKKMREQGSGGLGSQELQDRAERDRWGPGGEVVQELKDVIWKVGERRRKMTIEGTLSNVVPPDEEAGTAAATLQELRR